MGDIIGQPSVELRSPAARSRTGRTSNGPKRPLIQQVDETGEVTPRQRLESSDLCTFGPMRTLMLALCLAMLGFIATAEAHFKLNAPAAMLQQSEPYGDPQKSPPCGGNPGTPTNAVTAVQSGTMLSISITETIGHPGHYRVALAPSVAELPPAPTVTDANCDGLVPTSNPMLPILGDGLFRHTTRVSGVTQTFQVPIPAGMTCTNCVLQVLEYMADHAQPCFYYHCAKVNISPNAPPPPDGGIDPGGDGGMDQPGPADPGGGCSASGGAGATGLLGGLAVGLLMLRRRRRR